MQATAVDGGAPRRRGRRRGWIWLGGTLALVLTVLAGSQLPSDAVVMGGVVGFGYSFPDEPDGYSSMQASAVISEAGGNRSSGSNYYWAINWPFTEQSGGYIGLQNRAGEHYVNYSIWHASSWSDVSSAANCRQFDHEGSGVQCDMPFDWSEGSRYQLSVTDVGGGRVWEGAITDESTGERIVIARINTPSDFGGFGTHVGGFIEEYSQGGRQLGSCSDAQPFAMTIHPIVLDGNVLPTSTSGGPYGDCASHGKISCDTALVCSASVNGGTTRPPASKTLVVSPGAVDGLVELPAADPSVPALPAPVDGLVELPAADPSVPALPAPVDGLVELPAAVPAPAPALPAPGAVDGLVELPAADPSAPALPGLSNGSTPLASTAPVPTPAVSGVQVVAAHSGRCLSGVGDNVAQSSCSRASSQHWNFDAVSPGVYELRSDAGYCVDVSGGQVDNGANVITYPCTGGSNQQWEAVPVSAGVYQLRGVQSGKCLDVFAASSDELANIGIWDCHAGDYQHQQWRFSLDR